MRYRAASVPYHKRTMSTPATPTTRDLSGKYILNKRLSDSTDKIFKEQGVGWISRLKLSTAPIVTAWIRHFRERGREYLEIDGVFHNRNSAMTERYALDGRPLEFDDVCGRPAVSRGWRVRTTEIKDPLLRRGWVNDVLSHDAIYTSVEGYVRGDLKRRWIEEQMMGFQDIAGDRRFVRQIKLTTEKGEVVKVRLVYDYCEGGFDVTRV